MTFSPFNRTGSLLRNNNHLANHYRENVSVKTATTRIAAGITPPRTVRYGCKGDHECWSDGNCTLADGCIQQVPTETIPWFGRAFPLSINCTSPFWPLTVQIRRHALKSTCCRNTVGHRCVPTLAPHMVKTVQNRRSVHSVLPVPSLASYAAGS